MSEKLSPERAMRLLRAKAAELENFVKNASSIESMREHHGHEISLAADIALVASLLADMIERWEQPSARPMLEQEFREGFEEGHQT